MGFITPKRAAEIWEVTPQWVTSLCRAGEIEGAERRGGRWVIPDNVPRPGVSGYTFKPVGAIRVGVRKHGLPVGVSDYPTVVEEFTYVDKTLLIRDLIDSDARVTLFTRPRRFGKTLTMSMVKTFFEDTGEDTSRYFEDSLVWACGSAYRREQGSCQVIWLSFKDARCSTWERTLESIGLEIAAEFRRHGELGQSEKLSDNEKKLYDALCLGLRSATQADLERSIETLSYMLAKHHNQKVVVVIDEYDAPINYGMAHGWYSQVVEFMRNLFAFGLKDNPNLRLATMTGVFRLAKEGIFSGLNHLKVSTVFSDDEYSGSFGFTADEVKLVLAYRGRLDAFETAKIWYDGYRFGKAEVFNPWSVSYFLMSKCKPGPYWVDTSSNDFLNQVVWNQSPEIVHDFEALLQGGTISAPANEFVTYSGTSDNNADLYGILANAGYLMAVGKSNGMFGGTWEFQIPNYEVGYAFRHEIAHRLNGNFGVAAVVSALYKAVLSGDADALRESLSGYLQKSVSYFDTAHEVFYHGMVMGLLGVVQEGYRIKSNRESGDGRYDIALLPRETLLPAIVLELKVAQDGEDMDAVAQGALVQIEAKGYGRDFEGVQVHGLVAYGVAFRKKTVAVASRVLIEAGTLQDAGRE